jgi:dihydrofolate reductase
MLPVIYSMSVSLDGFIAGPTGDIGWTAPDAEQFRFHIEQTRHVAAHLCGRGLYQEMLVWETSEQTISGEAELEFARIWRPIPKVVFSRTLNSVAGNARLATDDIATEVGRLRDQAGEGVDRRIPPVRQPGHPRRRNPVLHAARQTPRPAADRVPHLQLPRRLPSLPARPR